ncbi:DUF3253 domain-containing protein [Telmatospirillum sp. J64-1]|uniref:DUF3253 domain-containing protein n=1 Tax=Telmatospirillum sp. J64-1 TaxID=2502183 RepID=UPI00115F4005|nr:DUF3253 domain-containing protein [Telmatospirillum sp. J64-1]
MSQDVSNDKDRDDPVAQCILEAVAQKPDVSPEDVARIFAESKRRPNAHQPRDAWRRYLMAVRQQAIHLARQGRIEITRRGETVDPDDFKGVIRLRLPRGGE